MAARDYIRPIIVDPERSSDDFTNRDAREEKCYRQFRFLEPYIVPDLSTCQISPLQFTITFLYRLRCGLCRPLRDCDRIPVSRKILVIYKKAVSIADELNLL